MGIYTNGSLYGVRMYNFNEDGVSNMLFEEKYDEKMSREQMRESFLFYAQLKDKKNIYFQFYTECTSTMNNNLTHTETFMDWFPMSLTTFLEHFRIESNQMPNQLQQQV